MNFRPDAEFRYISTRRSWPITTVFFLAHGFGQSVDADMKTKPPGWQSEQGRLHSLRQLKILDTPREKQFDELVQLAAEICDVPIAAFSLVDEERLWFKSIVGLNAQQIPTCDAFCAYTIMDPTPLIVPDAKLDQGFARNPLVVGPPYIRFYAGVAVSSPADYRIGALALIDQKPRKLTGKEVGYMRVLASQLERLLELRLRTQATRP